MLNILYNTKFIRIEKEVDVITVEITFRGKEIKIHIEDEMKGLSALFGDDY